MEEVCGAYTSYKTNYSGMALKAAHNLSRPHFPDKYLHRCCTHASPEAMPQDLATCTCTRA